MLKCLGPALCGVLALGMTGAAQQALGDNTLRGRRRSAYRRNRGVTNRRRQTLFRILERYRPQRERAYEVTKGRGKYRNRREKLSNRRDVLRRQRDRFATSEGVIRRERGGGTYIVRSLRRGGMRVRTIERRR